MRGLSLLLLCTFAAVAVAVASARFDYRHYQGWRGYKRCSEAEKAQAYQQVDSCVGTWTSRYTRDMWSCSVVEEVLDCYAPLRKCGNRYSECEAWEELKYLAQSRSGVRDCRAYESYRQSMRTYGCH